MEQKWHYVLSKIRINESSQLQGARTIYSGKGRRKRTRNKKIAMHDVKGSDSKYGAIIP